MRSYENVYPLRWASPVSTGLLLSLIFFLIHARHHPGFENINQLYSLLLGVSANTFDSLLELFFAISLVTGWVIVQWQAAIYRNILNDYWHVLFIFNKSAISLVLLMLQGALLLINGSSFILMAIMEWEFCSNHIAVWLSITMLSRSDWSSILTLTVLQEPRNLVQMIELNRNICLWRSHIG